MAYPPGSYLYWSVFLSQQDLPVGSHTIGPAGEGQVWILREMDVYNNAATPSTVNLALFGDATFAYASFSGYLDPDGISFVQWTGRVLIAGSQTVEVVVGGNGSDVTVSGIVLPATLIT